ncbi:hypothetical protein M8J77_012980 [Diaphorina citri]|nr:hypothetical protein M8J77_012980 [Diaphorina citri]
MNKIGRLLHFARLRSSKLHTSANRFEGKPVVPKPTPEAPPVVDTDIDAVSNKQKNEGWEKIAAEMRAQPGVLPRETAKYRKAWENIKKARRTEFTREKVVRMQTGGGVPDLPTIENDPELDGVLDNIELTEVTDSDWVYLNRNVPKPGTGIHEFPIPIVVIPPKISPDSQGTFHRELPALIPPPKISPDSQASILAHMNEPPSDDPPSPRNFPAGMLAHTNDPTSDPPSPDIVPSFPSSSNRNGAQKKQGGPIRNRNSYFAARHKAIEAETAARVARYKALQEQDAQLHNLRMEWEKERIQMERNLLEFKMEQEKKKYGCL